MMAGCGEALQFHEMGLDDRLLKAIAKLGWGHPTLIQEKGIPLALEGKDILARAKTGSGKTAVFAIPVIQKILQAKPTASSPQVVRALVLVPSKELCQQAARNIKELSSCCSRDVRVVDVSNATSVASLRTVLMEKPDIVVGTPSRVLAHLQQKTLVLRETLEVLVVDEADLIFSYGYEDDIKAVLSHLPSIYQSFLTSATLTEDVQDLKKLVLHNPVVLKLEESDLPEEDRLTQYHIRCSSEDKFLLIYTLLKLGLVRGKTLLFVNDIEHCYKLKLFLEQFSIKSCVLNSELPHNSRCHVVDEFNRGIYDYIIATDEVLELPSQVAGKGRGKGKHKKKKKDKEYGVARGIDFQGVENVINFDFPLSPDSYVHRVGRTARGFDYGTALAFVCPGEEQQLASVEERLRGAVGESSTVVKPYRFRMSEIEGFRYRVSDALHAVTKAAVREARLKEIRTELVNSERLKTHFEDNPRDLQVLKHDKVLQPARVQPHLKHIPSYLLPKALQAPDPPLADGQHQAHHIRYHSKHRRPVNSKKRKNDPLKTFTYATRPPKKRFELIHHHIILTATITVASPTVEGIIVNSSAKPQREQNGSNTA